MENSSPSPTVDRVVNKRHSVSGGFLKHFRLSKRKSKTKSVLFYYDDNISETGTSYISEPTNFQRHDISRVNIELECSTIQECPFDVTGYGKLLMKDKFKLKKPKKKKLTVFLFEKIIVLTTEHKVEDVYFYYASIKINNLSIAPVGYNKKKILIRDFNNSKLSNQDIEYKLKAKTVEMQNTWRQIIEKCLWLQLASAKDDPNG